MNRPVGIDLGTTFSAVAYVAENGKAVVIPNSEGQNVTPSVIFFDGEAISVGLDARTSATSTPDGVVQFVKRQIGDSGYRREVGSQQYSAIDLSAMILRKLKTDAEVFLARPVTEAVITVPAYFAEAQRSNTVAAGRRAGLSIRAVINEPTAAAIDYGLEHMRNEQVVLVYDLGGGTFDVTLMRVKPDTNSGDPTSFEIIAADGNAMLGGKDWDDCIVRRIAEEFEAKFGLDPRDDPYVYQQLLLQAEQAKCQLSARQHVALSCDYSREHLSARLSRMEFEDATRHLLEVTRATVREVLKASHEAHQAVDVDVVLLVGGSTRMPMVKAMLQEELGEPVRSSPKPDETVARGAAIYAAALAESHERLGASVDQALECLRPIEVHDVTSHTLGTLARDGSGRYIKSSIISRNSRIPACKTRSDYATGRDNQDVLVVPVLQGEPDDPRMCSLVACWEFFGIPPRSAGKSRLSVTFGYDASGIIQVEAEDILTRTKLARRQKEVATIEELLAPPLPPLCVALCIDVSGSMSGYPLQEAKQGAIDAVHTILGTGRGVSSAELSLGGLQHTITERASPTEESPAPANDRNVGIVSFASVAGIECPAVADTEWLLNVIHGLNSGGGTDIAAGVQAAHFHLLDAAPGDARREIVLLTDGQSPPEPALAAADAAKRDGVVLRTIGCGDRVDKELLAAIASSSDQAQFVADSSQIRSALANVAVQIMATLSVP